MQLSCPVVLRLPNRTLPPLLWKSVLLWFLDACHAGGLTPVVLYGATEDTLSLIEHLPYRDAILCPDENTADPLPLSEGQTVFYVRELFPCFTPEDWCSLLQAFQNCEEPSLALTFDGVLMAGFVSGKMLLQGQTDALDARCDRLLAQSEVFPLPQPAWLPVTDAASHHQATVLLNERHIKTHMQKGVFFPCTDGVLLAPDAVIGAGSTILPGTLIQQCVTIGADCTIGPRSVLSQSSVGDRCTLNEVQCYQSVIHADVDMGPFVHIRPNSEIHSFVHIGDFVEVKNSTVGAGTGISHLTYVGDSDVGKNVNFGCGVVTVNYDGVHKNRCVIEDEAFLGCNTNLIAPVRVGKGAYTAAGSTITDPVPDEALAIGRVRQTNKEGFASKKLAGRKKKV